MEILGTSKSGFWARHMRCLLLFCEDHLALEGCEVSRLYQYSQRRHISRMVNTLLNPHVEKIIEKKVKDHSEASYRLRNILPKFSFSSVMMNRYSHDLRRFLEEVGTDPKEARYWLKYFHSSSEPFSPFAVIQVDENVFADKEVLEGLSSTVSFLHRNNMKCVIVHGCNISKGTNINFEKQQELRHEMNKQSMLLASVLEMQGAPARPLFTGTNLLQASHDTSKGMVGVVDNVNTDPIKWVMEANSIPIIQSIGETPQSQLLIVDVLSATAQLAKALQPLKVLLVSNTGGIHDEKGEVIPNINVPADIHKSSGKPWCTQGVRNQIHFIGDMLQSLPAQSSVVMSSPHKLLSELFTHHGSGTFFKITEPIYKYHSLEKVDEKRLHILLNKCFGKELNENYFEELSSKLHTIYVSEGYNAAAIVLKDGELNTPYLDKFAVSLIKQSEGVGDVLWQHLRQDFKQLFWRSQASNIINPWYFKKSDGSWCSGKWIIFWYGSISHIKTSQLIDYAIFKEESFYTELQEEN